MSFTIRLKQFSRFASVTLCLACAQLMPTATADDAVGTNPQLTPPANLDASLIGTDALSSQLNSPLTTDSQVELVGYSKKYGWSKGDLQFSIYGSLMTDMVYSTSRTNTGPYTLYVFSDETHGEEDFEVDVRRSRFGLDVYGSKIACLNNAKSHVRVEVDFEGSFVTENKASILLRHAYWEVRNEDFRLLAGQTWDVISPLNPGTLNYSVGWIGGNIGYRRAQFRAERYLQLRDSLALTLQASLNQDIVSDFSTTPGVRRESAGWPVIEGRFAFTLGDKKEIGHAPELGISGHIGETGYDFLTAGPPPLNLPAQDDARFKTWSFNADLRLPLNECWGVNAEFFTGANLSNMLGGIGQGVCPCMRKSIRSTGGWVDVWHDWSDRLHSHAGFGIDDPNDNDLLFGRSYNQFIFANISYDVSKHWMTGFEVTDWRTHYIERRLPPNDTAPTAPGEAVVFEWLVKYGF